MKIGETITALDGLKFNKYTPEQKISWLSRLDTMVKKQIIDTHEGGEMVEFTGYDETTPLETELLIPAPFDEVYLRWMEAQIDYHNAEYDRYNNAIESFNAGYEAFKNDYNRNHMPKGQRLKFF